MDGKSIAYGKSWKNRINIFVKDLKTQETKQLTFSLQDINNFFWADNNTIIYSQDNGGDENFHLYSLSREGGNALDLTPFEGVTCSVVESEKNDGKILIQMNLRNKEIFDVYKVDIKNASMELIARNPGDVSEWMADHDGKLRLAEFSDGINSGIRYRMLESDEWRTVATYNFKDMVCPLLFTFDNEQIYVSSNYILDKAAIFKYDLTTGKETECIFKHPMVDVSFDAGIFPLIISQKKRKILGCRYIVDKIEYKFFDEAFEKMQNFVDSMLANYENYFVSSDKDEEKFIVLSMNDKTPGAYYLFDAIKWELVKLFDLMPWLEESEMSPMKPISFTSRDGVTINGYLTLPIGKTNNLPLVIIPHGGPWSRDFLTFNPEVQFLANRGYGVLQINFRGSSGYGRKFLEAGYKQWGLKMQDDITDGVKWAINQKIAIVDKIAIYGTSYGGYAALTAITKTPDLYAAAVDYVGISNIFTFFDTMPPYWEFMREMFYEIVGHPINDKERLIAASPIFNVHKVKTPLFVVQGANDPRVKKEHSDQIVQALRKRGIPVEYMIKDNEGHGFVNEENNFDFYQALENFLQKHLRP